MRAATGLFGVNLFVPGSQNFDTGAFTRFARSLEADAAELGIALDLNPRTDDDGWEQKLAYLEDHPVPLVSFTFGLPEPQVLARLKAVGTTTAVSVPLTEEALAAEANGADVLVVQGPRAGGHSATFNPFRRIDDVPTAALVERIRQGSALPVIAAGGVESAADVRELLDAGADAVAVGTLLLRTVEAGTSPTHRAALGDARFTRTALTSAFTGRPARALVNRFMEHHDAEAIVAYPQVHFLTAALRQAAGKAGDAERLHLWAGTGWRSTQVESATVTVQRLAAGL